MYSYILFYSGQCEYSKQTLSFITNHKLEDQFLFVNIDTPGVKIPNFVSCVPLIFNPNRKTIIIEDSIDNLLNNMLPQQARPPPQVDFQPASDTFKGATDQFSFIDEKDTMGSQTYKNIDEDEVTEKLTPVMTTDGSTKFDEKQYNSFLSQRDSDIASLFPRKNSVI
jgi:hypothetical protein